MVLDFGLGGGMAVLVSRLGRGPADLGFSALVPEPLGCGRTAAGVRGGAGPYPDGAAFRLFWVSYIRQVSIRLSYFLSAADSCVS